MRIGQTAWFLSGLNVFFGFNLVANSITIGEGYNFMRTGLTCFILRQFMVVGRLSIAITNGPMQYIKACDSGPDVAIRLAHGGVLWRLLLCPDLAFGESYVDGDLKIESGKIDDLLALLIANNKQRNRHWLARLMLAFDTRLTRFSTLNFPGRSQRNAAHLPSYFASITILLSPMV